MLWLGDEELREENVVGQFDEVLMWGQPPSACPERSRRGCPAERSSARLTQTELPTVRLRQQEIEKKGYMRTHARTSRTSKLRKNSSM